MDTTATNPSIARENVKTRTSSDRKKQALSGGPSLKRTTFSTSREMDFFSKKELITQTGHDVAEWPLVILKELVDNALDACEEASIQPEIKIVADPSGITVSDNGPGLPESTLKGALNFSERTSSREQYVAPDRGAQGNALKTLLPMPKVLDEQHGKMIVMAHGKRHVLVCGSDPISQRAVIQDDATDVVTVGTSVRIEWSERSDGYGVRWPMGRVGPLAPWGCGGRFREMVEGFALFNPHATITLNWFGDVSTWEATNPAFNKWRPCRPTSSHWYELKHLERLVAAYITHDQDLGSDRLVSDLVAEFDGLSGSQKRSKVLDEADLKRVKLSEFAVDGQLDSERINRLLMAMQRHTRPVQPKALGTIGEDHFRTRFLQMGIDPDSFQYSKQVPNCKKATYSPDAKSELYPLPYVVESAFGWRGDASDDHRKIYPGANWSAAIQNPFRSFGKSGEGLEGVLAKMHAGAQEPIVFALHVCHPRIQFTDRGKSALVLSEGAQQ